jgi:hypothetical protein
MITMADTTDTQASALSGSASETSGAPQPETHERALDPFEGASASPQVNPEGTPRAAGELDESRVTEIAERKAREIAERIADQKARAAEEQAFRRAQSKFDKDLNSLKDRFTRRERELLDSLPQAGLDPDKVKAIQARRSQDDELEALRERAAAAEGLEAVRLAQQYRDRFVAVACAEAGINPADPRLDLSDPDKFTKSLARALRGNAAKPGAEGERPANGAAPQPATRPAAPERPLRSAREDLDLLGGGGGAAADLPDDPDELWRAAQKTIPSLKRRSA